MLQQSLNVTIVQAPLVWANKAANLDYFTRKLKHLPVSTDLIVLPEMFTTGFITDPEQISETMDGQVMQWMAQTSARLNCVITGSIAIKEWNCYFNRLIWMRPDGTFEKYDKHHLFRMGNEDRRFTQGLGSLIVDLKGWKIKPLVCYDLRFPVWSKNTLVNDKYEYDILIYVANWPASRSYAWQTLLSARAIENQAYCIGVNRVGDDGKGIPHIGGSVILDFKGKLLSGCEDKQPDIVTHTIDYESLNSYRERFKVALDWDDFTVSGK